MFRSLLFTRIVPIVKDIGLWGEKVQKAYADMGVLDMAGVDLGALMKADEDIAENLDRERAAIEARKAEVDATIAAGRHGLIGSVVRRLAREQQPAQRVDAGGLLRAPVAA